MAEPESRAFTYVLIPADRFKPVEERHWEGGDDEALRARLGEHFRSNAMTRGQEDALRAHIRAQVKGQPVNDAVLDAMDMSTIAFEIVPIIYPTAQSDYIATSLYIDQAGAFKELQLNERAAKLAQRPIRGDAFLLRCIDNEKEDKWYRIDTTEAAYNDLYANPPPAAVSPEMKAQQLQVEQQKQATLEKRKLPKENVLKAFDIRTEGNEAVKAGDWEKARQTYTRALELLDGFLPPAEQTAAQELRMACWSNRALCNLKLEHWKDVLEDCACVAVIDARNPKILFRTATAHLKLRDFERARKACAAAEMLAPEDGAIRKLMADINKQADVAKSKEKNFFKNWLESGAAEKAPWRPVTHELAKAEAEEKAKLAAEAGEGAETEAAEEERQAEGGAANPLGADLMEALAAAHAEMGPDDGEPDPDGPMVMVVGPKKE